MKKQLFHLYLNDDEYRKVLQALIALKNNLIEQGRYTDACLLYTSDAADE